MFRLVDDNINIDKKTYKKGIVYTGQGIFEYNFLVDFKEAGLVDEAREAFDTKLNISSDLRWRKKLKLRHQITDFVNKKFANLNEEDLFNVEDADYGHRK